jgi:serine/threonine protein kinase
VRTLSVSTHVRCSHLSNCRSWVLKEYVLDGEKSLAKLMREVMILRQLAHNNIASVESVFTETEGGKQLAYMQMPLYARGTLADYRGSDDAEEQAVMRGTLRGLEHIHRAGVIHHDIKPENVFLHEDKHGFLHPKIGDFDISRDLKERGTWATTQATQRTGAAGTLQYMAPELFNGQPGSERSDMYSLGLVFLHMHFGPVKQGFNPLAAARRVDVPDHPDKNLRRLLMQMLSVKPSDRPTATEALAHPFFSAALQTQRKRVGERMDALQKDQGAAVGEQQEVLAGQARAEMQLQNQAAAAKKQAQVLQRRIDDLRGQLQKMDAEVRS